MNAPVGPPIWTRDPPSTEMSRPPTTAVHRPAPGVTPLAMAIPKQATASALILTGISMLASIRHLPGDEPADLLPAMAMILMTLISNSFGTGIAAGILVHVAVQILAGRIRQLPIGLILLAIPLGIFFYGAATRH